jgi:cyclopropane fatty-acyl-phospholipid synthase-like methyltransferase
MLEMIASTDERFDVILAAFALHHFDSADKQDFLRIARDRLTPGGEVLLVDVVRRDGEKRPEYLARYAQMVRTWPMDAAVQDRIVAHVTSFDFPEQVSTLEGWAPGLGYAPVAEFYRGGSDTQAGWRLTLT